VSAHMGLDALDRLALIADRLLAMKAEGLTMRAIADRLNAEGIASPARGAWQAECSPRHCAVGRRDRASTLSDSFLHIWAGDVFPASKSPRGRDLRSTINLSHQVRSMSPSGHGIAQGGVPGERDLLSEFEFRSS
jgi:hypothetical protein